MPIDKHWPDLLVSLSAAGGMGLLVMWLVT